MIELAVSVRSYRFADAARRLATEWSLPFVDRPEKGGFAALLSSVAKALLVLTGEGWFLKDQHGECGFTPGLATVRVKRLRDGVQQPDGLVVLGELGPGDSVIDATLGASVDALVCSHVVGARGRVVGFEASMPLFVLAREGLRTFRISPTACAVEPRFGLAHELLATYAPASVDVVFFDAMFERPKRATSHFEMLRRYAVHDQLQRDTLELARTVARRWVVVKCGRYGPEFKRLGLDPVPSAHTGPLQWARLPARDHGSVQGMSAARNVPLGSPSSPIRPSR